MARSTLHSDLRIRHGRRARRAIDFRSQTTLPQAMEALPGISRATWADASLRSKRGVAIRESTADKLALQRIPLARFPSARVHHPDQKIKGGGDARLAPLRCEAKALGASR